MATIKAAGINHKVVIQKGDVHVVHPDNAGPNINLTAKSGAKTVQQGVAAVVKYHKTKGHKKGK